MGSIEEGAKQVVKSCLKVKPKEKVVIITDNKTSHIATAIAREMILDITSNIAMILMEAFGTRPVDFHEVIARELAKADVSIYAAQGVKGELQSFRRPMIEAIQANKKLRHAHMPDITSQIMKEGMCSDYKEVQRISQLVYNQVKNAKKIKVATEKGTNFTAKFSPDINWVVSDGDIQPGKWENLPAGEVFTCPIDFNGEAVIDGCLGDFFTKKYGSIENTPVTLAIREGRVSSVSCGNQELQEDLAAYILQTDENSNRIGEFAIGTNIGLIEIIGNLLQDEKYPGIHIAAGSSLPHKTGADWDSKVHVDGVIKNPTVIVDGETIMKNGKFCLD